MAKSTWLPNKNHPPISEIINQANFCQQQKFDLDEIKIKNVTMNVTKNLGEL